MKIKRNRVTENWKFIGKKLVIVVMMFGGFFYFLSQLKNNNPYNFHLDAFPTEAFLTERFPLDDLMKSALKIALEVAEQERISIRQADIKDKGDIFPVGNEIIVFTEKLQVGKEEVQSIAALFFGDNIRRLMTEKFARWKLRGVFGSRNGTGDRIMDIVLKIGRYNQQDYDKFKKAIPGLVYSYKEMKVLRSTGGFLLTIGLLADDRTKKWSVAPYIENYNGAAIAVDGPTSAALLPYAPYFCAMRPRSCIIEGVILKAYAAIFPIFFILLFCHLIWVDIGTVLERKLKKSDIRMNIFVRWSYIARFPLTFIFAVSRNTNQVSEDIIERYIRKKNIREGRKISASAEAVWKDLTDELEPEELEQMNDLLGHKESAQSAVSGGSTTDAASALRSLIKNLEKIRMRKKSQKNGEVQTKAIVAHPIKTNGAPDRTSKEIKLERIHDLLHGNELDCRSWPNGKLDRLISVLTQLEMCGSDMISAYVSRPDVEKITENGHPFMAVIRRGNESEIRNAIAPKMIVNTDQSEGLADGRRLPDSIHAVIIGQFTAIRVRANLLKYLENIGVESSEFLEDSPRAVDSAVKKDPLNTLIVMIVGINHDCSRAVRKSGIPWVVVSSTGEHFSREVIEKYYAKYGRQQNS